MELRAQSTEVGQTGHAAPASSRPDHLAAVPHQAAQFLQLLGKDPALAWFRTFGTGRSQGANRSRKGADLQGLYLQQLEADNGRAQAVYCVIGEAQAATGQRPDGTPTGCVTDADITAVPALFVEWDDRPVQWQEIAWQELGLPLPTFQLATGGKSVHTYWVLDQALPPAEWAELQTRLVEHCGADRLINPSRVMRCPGFRYVDKAKGELGPVVQLINATGSRYSAAQIAACMPAQEAPEAPRIVLEVPRPIHSHGTDDLPPRPPEALQDALRQVPPFDHGQGRRAELLGLCQRLHVDLGADQALALMQAHSPAVRDLAGYFRHQPREISPGSLWPFLRDHYGIDISRRDLKGTRPPEPRQEAAQHAQGQQPPSQPPATAEDHLEALGVEAGRLLQRRVPYAHRLPLLRAHAEALGVTVRDGELLGILKTARRRRIHGDASEVVEPGQRIDLSPEPWAWDGLVLRGALNLWVALPKVGKTSLALAFLAAWHRNEPAFLDRNLIGPCPPVLIVGNDQGQADWGRMLQAVGWLDQDHRLGGPVVGLAHAGRPLHLDPEGIDRIAAFAQQHPGLLILIDSLHASVALLGLKEESPEIAEPIADLMELVEPHGATVVLIHHASKGRATDNASSASRGSTALPALASQMVKLAPARSENPRDRRRLLTTEGRGGLPQSLLIEREGADWILHGDADQLEREQAAAEAVEKLTDRQADALDLVVERWEDHRERTTAADLVEGLRLAGAAPLDVARRALQVLARKGLVESIGKAQPGRGSRLYEFWPSERTMQARARAHTGAINSGSFGSVGSVGGGSREDPDQPDLLQIGPTDPNDPNDPKDQSPAREGCRLAPPVVVWPPGRSVGSPPTSYLPGGDDPAWGPRQEA